MKKIFIPVAIVVLILAVVAIILSKTSGTNNNPGYHTHANGEIHYDSITAENYHTHANGEVHYGTH